MGYTFTFGDIEKICKSFGMKPVKKGSRFWEGFGSDGKFRRTQIHSHGSGGPVATGTARRIADQLLFKNLEEMHRYLNEL